MDKVRKILNNILNKIAEEHELEDYGVVIKAIPHGSHFLSDAYTVTISSVKPKLIDLKLFAKIAFVHATVRNQLPINLFYKTEANFYSDVVPSLQALQEKHKVPQEQRFRFAKFYGSHLKEYEEAIVLVDLTSHGYKMYDRLATIDREYAMKAVEEIAKFHALSLAYRNEYPGDFNRNINESEFLTQLDTWYEKVKEPFKKMAENGMSTAPDNLKGRLQKFIDDNWSKEQYVKHFGPSKLGFLIHADYRPSNILHKCEDGQLKHLIPIDYQAFRLGSPSIDLLYLIYCSTDATFRKENLNALLDHYYDSFAKFLILLKIDPDAVFSRQEFDKEYNDMFNYGLCMALAFLPTVLATGESIPKVSEIGIQAFSKVIPNDACNKRMLDIINEYIAKGKL